MSSDRVMEVTSLLLREGVLRRDDAEHRAVYEELGKDPILAESVRERLAAVGYALVDDLGHVGVRVNLQAENAWSIRNRMGLSAPHIRLIAYLWTQLVYREVVNLRRDLRGSAPGQSEFFDTAEEEPFVSYRAVWNTFAERMSANRLKGIFQKLKRDRFIRYDERRDRIWAGGSLYVLIDRARMEEFVVELARRLGTGDAASAVEQIVTGTIPPPEGDPGEQP